MTNLDKFIADNRWRRMGKAPCAQDHIVCMSSWNQHAKAVVNFFGQWQDWREDKPIDVIDYFTHFRPFPDDRLADICQVLVDALHAVKKEDYGLKVDAEYCNSYRDTTITTMVDNALAKAEEIAKGESDAGRT